MLKTRILTAVVLLAAFIPAAIYLPEKGWAALISAVVGIAAWEWAGLAGFGKMGRLVYGIVMFALFAALSALFFYAFPFGALPSCEQTAQTMRVVLNVFALCILLFWFVAVPLWLRFRWSLKGFGGLLVGLIVLIPPGMFAAFGTGGVFGDDRLLLLAIVAIAWVADIAAYAAGRCFGKRKLAPNISPGKTWEGVAGGFVAVFFYFCALNVFLNEGGAWSFLLLDAALILTAAAVLGDLFESLLKRQAGVKDSSNLLPGHGGVLDRIDSVLALLAVVYALLILLIVL